MSSEKKAYTFRKLINNIHLWLGIPSAIILFGICLTGTIYAFSTEITEWVDRDKFVISVSPGGNTLHLKNLISSLEEKNKGLKVTSVLIPEEKNKAWTFTLAPKETANKGEREKDTKDRIKGPNTIDKKEQQKNNEIKDNKRDSKVSKEKEVKGKNEKEGGAKKFDRSKIKNYLVNPYTGEITGDAKTPTSKFFSTIMGLHRWLLLDSKVGGIITGIATIIFILMEITGLILWLPKKIKNWRKWNLWKEGFTLKLKGKWKRVNYDLHNTLGFYTFLLVTVMAVTGLCFAFDWFKAGFASTFGVTSLKREEPMESIYSPGKKMELDQVVTKANAIFPYDGNLKINLPKDSTASITVSKTTNGFITVAGSDRVVFDQYSGAVLKTDRFSDKKFGEKVVALIYAIHVGEIFGTFTKIIYFIVCLIATSLPVTGTLIWVNKFKKKPKKAKSEKKIKLGTFEKI